MSKYRYPGAHPFTRDERDIFFGRKRDIEEVYRLVELEQLVVLFSKSGLGKSSLINAGVIPTLLENQEYHPFSIRFGACREGFDPPIEYSKEQLKLQYPIEGDGKGFLDQMVPNDNSLWKQMKTLQIHHEGEFNPILIFDQFEELFTYPRRWVYNFKKELGEVLHTQIPQRFRDVVEAQFATSGVAADPASAQNLEAKELSQLHLPLGCKVIFAIRSDRLSLLNDLTSHLPNVLKHCYELKALSQSQAEDAILFPAYKKDPAFLAPPFDYQNEALDKMLAYLTQGGEEEIESFQLQILCQAMERKVIDYQIKQITSNDLGNLESIYQNYYDNEIEQLCEEHEQKAVREFIEDGLILEEEQRRLTLYEGQINREFDVSPELLAKLVNSHLLRAEASPRGGFTYELSHDTLVAPVLRAKKRRQTVEAEQLAREENLQREKQLEDIRREAALEKQKRLRTKRLAMIAGITAAVAIFLGLIALTYARIANSQRSRALSNSLVALSSELKDRNATYALRFADAAVQSDENNARARQVYQNLFEAGRFGFYRQEIRMQGQIRAVGVLDEEGSQIVSAGSDNTVRIWDDSGNLLHTLEGHSGPVLALGIFPDSNFIATGGSDRSIRFWRLQASGPELLKTIPGAHKGDIVTMDISADGKVLASGSFDGRVKLWETGLGNSEPGNLLDELLHPESVFDLAFSPLPEGIPMDQAEIYLLTGCEDNRARMWKLQKDENVPGAYLPLDFDRPLDVFNDDKDVFAVAFYPRFPNPKLILTGNLGQTVKLWKGVGNDFWSSSTDQEAALLLGERGSITAALFDPEGGSLVAADEEGRIKFWNLPSTRLDTINKTKEVLEFRPDAEFRGHTDKVSGLTISRERTFLLSGSLDGTLKIWPFKAFLQDLEDTSSHDWNTKPLEELEADGFHLARIGLQPSEWDNFGSDSGLYKVNPYPADIIPPSDVGYKLRYVQYFEDRHLDGSNTNYWKEIRNIYERYFNPEAFSRFSASDKLLFLRSLTSRRDSMISDDKLLNLFREKTDMAASQIMNPAFYEDLHACELYSLVEILLNNFMFYDNDKLESEAHSTLVDILDSKLVDRAGIDLDFPGLLNLYRSILSPVENLRPEISSEYESMVYDYAEMVDNRAAWQAGIWREVELENYLDLMYKLYKHNPNATDCWKYLENALSIAIGQIRQVGLRGELEGLKSVLLFWGERRVSENGTRLGELLGRSYKVLAERDFIRGMRALDLNAVGKAFYESSYRYDYSDSLKAYYRQQAVNFLENANYLARTDPEVTPLDRNKMQRLLALSQGSLAWRLLKLGRFESALDYASKALRMSENSGFPKAGEMAITNLALAYLFTGNENQAVDLYLEYRNQPYTYRPEHMTFRNVFVEDLMVFREDPAFAEWHEQVDRILNLLDAR